MFCVINTDTKIYHFWILKNYFVVITSEVMFAVPVCCGSLGRMTAPYSPCVE